MKPLVCGEKRRNDNSRFFYSKTAISTRAKFLTMAFILPEDSIIYTTPTSFIQNIRTQKPRKSLTPRGKTKHATPCIPRHNKAPFNLPKATEAT